MERYNSKRRYKTRVDNVKTKVCRLWENMHIRCDVLSQQNESRFGKYQSVMICEDWYDFQNFAEWYYSVEYIKDDWQLDKDILSRDNIYSPEHCVFVPREINNSLIAGKRVNSGLPAGSSLYETKSGPMLDARFKCVDSKFSKRKSFSVCNEEDAFIFYKTAKKEYILHLAEKYKCEIDPRAYIALIDYEVVNR